MYLLLNELNYLSVELTTKCNAACPMCSRFHGDWDKGHWETRHPNKEMPLSDLNYDSFVKAFTTDVLQNMKQFIFNGKLGDPLIHPRALDFFEYIKTNSNAKVIVYTNASLRTPEFFKKLAKLTDGVIFSIDGLQDTNHIYRQRTDWRKIMDNAHAFISAGGYAIWDFLVFKHNEHQVLAAKALSESFGFKKFEIRKTNRFKGRDQFAYTAVDGELKYLEVPNNSNYVHEYHESYLDEQPDKLNISCSFKNSNKMFLSFNGKLWPCSYISEYYPMNKSVLDIIDEHGDTFNSIAHNSIEDILNHDYFKYILIDSWKTGNKISRECWKKCSVNHGNITEIEKL